MLCLGPPARRAQRARAPQEGAVTPLTVRWPEPDAAEKRSSSRAGGGAVDDDADDRTVFFARVLRSASEDAVRALFAAYGRVADINLFRAFQVRARARRGGAGAGAPALPGRRRARQPR